jgi:ankyrin repeat protein
MDALFYACFYGDIPAVEASLPLIPLDYLLKPHSHPYFTSKTTVLHTICYTVVVSVDLSITIVDILLSKGLDINSTDERTRTPLHVACQHRPHPFFIEYLLKNGADVNARDHTDSTPLHALFFHSYKPDDSAFFTILDYLLAAGANPYLCDVYGRNSFNLLKDYAYSDATRNKIEIIIQTHLSNTPKPAKIKN